MRLGLNQGKPGEELTNLLELEVGPQLQEYSQKFASLLYIEELQMEVDIRHYDMEDVFLNPSTQGGFLVLKVVIGLAKPKSRAHTFFFPHVLSAQRLAPARTRTRVVRLGAQCTDHWTTEQSHGIGVPAVQLTTHVERCTLYGRTVVWSYIQIFSSLMGYFYFV